MIKVISFSLWGTDPKYTIGAIRNAELAKEIYPGWMCRFYVGEDVTDDIIERLVNLQAEVVRMDGADWNGMFWRFLAAADSDVMISRDTDSRLSIREKAAVDEWLASDRVFHIMRDHPYHATEILGGMWGCCNGVLRNIKSLVEEYETGEFDNKYQVDQNFLKEVIYPLVINKSMSHDPYFTKKDKYNKVFPTARLHPGDFVGQVYNHLEQPQF